MNDYELSAKELNRIKRHLRHSPFAKKRHIFILLTIFFFLFGLENYYIEDYNSFILKNIILLICFILYFICKSNLEFFYGCCFYSFVILFLSAWYDIKYVKYDSYGNPLI